MDGNVIIVLQPRKHSAEDKSVGCCFLKCSSTQHDEEPLSLLRWLLLQDLDVVLTGREPESPRLVTALLLSAPDDVKASSCRAPSSLVL